MPSLSLPKGGGAIRGIGEKLSMNPATGTSSLSVPIATSPGRAGFQLELALSYSSGGGNGPFGLGWGLSTPSITRKTDQGLPRYDESGLPDVYVLSGAEDLVPVRIAAGGGTRPDVVERGAYRVERHRPRTEGLYARIERWVHTPSGDVHWRVTTKDNLLNVYGRTAQARIADPENAKRVFSWLLEETRDDRGNVVRYSYKGEDGVGVAAGKASEANRFAPSGGSGGPPVYRATAQRYPKRIQYGNRTPLLDREAPLPTSDDAYLFELVLDYGEHDTAVPTPAETRPWPARPDAFSTYRAGFEVRTLRLCRRALMFHRFAELGPGACLVRSTDFTYDEGATVTYLTAATQAGYTRNADGTYFRATMPALQLGYRRAELHDRLQTVPAESLAGLRAGVEGTGAQWVDLDGEGISGVLLPTEGAWFYKANLGGGKLAPPVLQRNLPSPAELGQGGQTFSDLDGDGQLELVSYRPPLAGFFSRTADGAGDGWAQFQALTELPAIDWDDPNLRFVDLDGDGFADVLITEDEAFWWYRSRGKAGFEPAVRLRKTRDELEGPAVVFADGTETIQLADLSGDGLMDLVRVRNGEVCYWPNLGHGRFGRKVTLELPAALDDQAHFDAKRVRFSDIDGSGPSDLLYLHRDGVRIFLNQAGNALAAPVAIRSLPPMDPLSGVSVADLLGNGTTCLVWSSPLPGDGERPLAYVDLMDGQKPHLLESMRNGLGAETRFGYASSTKFYLQDKAAGRPWLTRLAFPVHVVERTERLDRVTGAQLVTRFAYHHGFFDGVEREFHGFGSVEQWDAESFGGGEGAVATTAASLFPEERALMASAAEPALDLPPVRTVTWFHTGAWLEREQLERELAKEYYRGDPLAPLLPDTILPAGLTVREQREAARALRGQILRQEIYAEDGTAASPHPYSVSERNHEVRLLQRAAGEGDAAVNGVFCVHPRNALEMHYERNPSDPRVQHELVLEVDDFGNTTKSAAIAYPRRVPVEPEQARLWATYTETSFANRIAEDAWYRVGVPLATTTSELTGLAMPAQGVLSVAQVLERAATATEIPYEQEASGADPAGQRRVIERERRFYYRDDLSGPLPHGQIDSRALPHETHKLALTPGLVAQVYGDRVSEAMLTGEGGYVRDAAGFWAPSGHVVYDPAQFFQPVQAVDPFGQRHTLQYDGYGLLPRDVEDPLHNRTTVGGRSAAGEFTSNGYDYRTLAPALITDPNRNRAAVAFDALGMVVASAVMGKEGEAVGDVLAGFPVEVPLAMRLAFFADPHAHAAALLGQATTRIIYDVDRFARAEQPALAATLMRETHFHDVGGATTKIQISFTYSDGGGQEVQKKIQAESGEAPLRLAPTPLPGGDFAPGELVRDTQGKVVLAPTVRRWVGTGRTVLNNKGKPVKQYEPFFSSTPLYEREREMTDAGVTPVLFYDPVERVIATLHPNHVYEKVVFNAWQETTFDVNDTVAPVGGETGDPRTDEGIAGFVRGYFETQPASWQTWYAQRINGQLGAAERDAAQKAAAHGDTPTTARVDAMGRTFVTLARNRFARGVVTIEETYATRVKLDIEGNQRSVTDAKGRVVMRYAYDVLGQQLRQESMEAGERLALSDVTGKPIRAWDSRGFVRRMTYDALRRPHGLYVKEGAGGSERLAERTGYGEGVGDAANHRTRAHQVFDAAGVVTSIAYDFKGNPLATRRELLPNYKQAVDWQQNPVANDGSFTTSLSYDALNRVLTSTTPDGSVQRQIYNEATLLDQVRVNLRGAAVATAFVTNIDYDAKGQRTRIAYGNGAVTTYQYDPQTFRLMNLRTTRPATPDSTASLLFRDLGVVQDLRYAYDPSGNITRIEDAALRTVFYDNQQVEPISRYTYDAVYRLIEAHGREHIGQNVFDLAPTDGNFRDFPFVGFRANPANPNDAQALRNYVQRYEYDAVGNFEVFRHQAGGSGWTRRYEYQEASLLEPTKQSNRLSRTLLGSGTDHVEPYSHDAHGNMTSMPHLAAMSWDFKDQLVRVNLGGGGTAYYVYDASGQRVRKVIESLAGVRQRERQYVGDLEIYREHDGDIRSLARDTLHIRSDKQRLGVADALILRDGAVLPVPILTPRFQMREHLHSTTIELDVRSALISYEEYHPGGTSALSSATGIVETTERRYRYIGKERDAETGFAHHSARYYAPWLGVTERPC